MVIAAVTISAAITAFGIYVSDNYKAGEMSAEALSKENAVISGDRIIFSADSGEAALIFYPGGKVDAEAYAPLMERLSAKGVDCIIAEMPFDLAVLDINAAEDIMADIHGKDIYIAGHSLGGSMAASFGAKNSGSIKGIILLAAYSAADLKNAELPVLSVYGSKDGVLNMEKYEKYRDNLPENLDENIIKGGCHAYFGDYGEQKGDGEADISPEEQLDKTAELIYAFIRENSGTAQN